MLSPSPKRFPCGQHRRPVLPRPLIERLQRHDQLAPELGQLVIHAGWNRWIHRAGDQPVLLQAFQGQREHALRYPFDAATDLVVADRSFRQGAHLDHAYTEFVRKPIGFVGYGGVGAASAIEQLRLIAIELQMVPVCRAVHIGMVESLGIMREGKTFEDFPHLAQAADRLLDDMSWWAKTLKPAREGMTTGVAAIEG